MAVPGAEAMTAPWILDFLNRRAKVEEEMLRAAAGMAKENSLIADKLRDWALRLGVPEDPEFGRPVAPPPIVLPDLNMVIDRISVRALADLFREYATEAVEQDRGRR